MRARPPTTIGMAWQNLLRCSEEDSCCCAQVLQHRDGLRKVLEFQRDVAKEPNKASSQAVVLQKLDLEGPVKQLEVMSSTWLWFAAQMVPACTH